MSGLLLWALLLASPAGAAEFSAAIGDLDLGFSPRTAVYRPAAVLAAASRQKPAPAPEPEAEPLLRVASTETWARLVEKVSTSPSLSMTTEHEGTVYDVLVLTTTQPVAGQECRGGTVENSFFLVRSREGAGAGIYPSRLAAHCRLARSVKGSVSIDADPEGNVLEAVVQAPTFGIPEVRRKKSPPRPDPKALQAFIDKLVGLLLSL